MTKQRRLIPLTKKEKDALWNETGPYSQASLIIQSRILDDRVSRVFLEVEVAINPYTFEFVRKHREEFIDDEMVQQLLDHSDFRGQPHGYVSCAYSKEYSQDLLEEANVHLGYAEKTIIKMHKFVIKHLDVEIN